MSNGPFYTIEVTDDLHRMIRHLERNAVAYTLAKTEREAADAYTIMSYNRKELYEYLENLERIAEVSPHIERTHLRFT